MLVELAAYEGVKLECVDQCQLNVTVRPMARYTMAYKQIVLGIMQPFAFSRLLPYELG